MHTQENSKIIIIKRTRSFEKYCYYRWYYVNPKGFSQNINGSSMNMRKEGLDSLLEKINRYGVL